MVTSPLPLLFVRDVIVLMVRSEQHTIRWNDFLAIYEMNCGEPFDVHTYGTSSDVKQLLLSCSPWIMVRMFTCVATSAECIAGQIFNQ